MKNLLILLTAINLILLPVSSVLCQEQNSAMSVEITSYMIGGVNIEAQPTMVGDATVVIEPIRPEGVSASSEAAESMPAQFPDQPIPKISCGLSVIPDNNDDNKTVITITIENIGTAEAKNVKAVMDVPYEVDFVETSDMKPENAPRASNDAAGSEVMWAGEVEASTSQEFTYEMFLAKAPEGDLRIPLEISSSGSGDWLVDVIIILAEWLFEKYYQDLYEKVEVPGFNATMVLAGLAAIYLVRRRS